MSKAIKTLPCPFCGGQAKVSNFPGAHNVWCENQPVKCGNRSMYTLEQWNSRCTPIGTLRRVGQVIVFDAIGDPHIKDGMEVFTSLAELKKTGD